MKKPPERAAQGEVDKLQKEQKENPSAEVGLQRRAKRLERICLILCIAVILLGISGIRLAWTVGKAVRLFELITEQLNFIGQQVDVIRQGIHQGVAQ